MWYADSVGLSILCFLASDEFSGSAQSLIFGPVHYSVEILSFQYKKQKSSKLLCNCLTSPQTVPVVLGRDMTAISFPKKAAKHISYR